MTADIRKEGYKICDANLTFNHARIYFFVNKKTGEEKKNSVIGFWNEIFRNEIFGIHDDWES